VPSTKQLATTPFTVTGSTPDDATIEFPDCVAEAKGSISLKLLVRQYTGTPQIRSIPAKQLYMILGRLRCLDYTLSKYNAGVAHPTPAFVHYWRRRTLNQLSGFGFQVQQANQPIAIVGLRDLIGTLETLFASDIEHARELIRGGLITFEALSELYRPDVPVQGRTGLGGHAGVFLVTEYYFEEHRSLVGMERSFHWSMEFIATMGEHFSVIAFTEVLSGWMGVRARPVSELIYAPVAPSEVADLRQRGAQYVQYGQGGAQFVAYQPHSFFIHSTGGAANTASLSRSGSCQLPTGGRIMIDPVRGMALGHHATQGTDEPSQAMIQLSGRYRRWYSAQSSKGGAAQDSLILWETVPEEFQIYCWPALVGFSFTAKAWGHVLVTGLQPIQFRDDAFDRLVISEERKQLIRALIRFGGGQGTDDIIGGKSGGTIILLHGPPGTGKTLTAEAIAELLHRPLYYVTMGELGIHPQEMERRLSDVLDLCAGWNAITLLDEADVFLETRTTNDLERNTLVCVMLRLLEYHPGLLFLTTNRVRSFDPAVESRVTVALRYDALAPSARVQIWKNLLEKVSLPIHSEVDFDALGAHAMNGRQIKNAVRLAVALAQERKSPIDASILNSTIQITNLGRQDMKADDSWKEAS
jgi:hypothetical protein